MNKIIGKLNNNKGESIAEILIAILVSVLGIAMLAMMIQTSSKQILSSSKKIKEYVADEIKIVERDSRVSDDNEYQANLWTTDPSPKPVSFYRGSGQLFAYVYKIEFGNIDIITFEKKAG